jgi:hypothetical protein
MPVFGRDDRCWNRDSSGVNWLPNIGEVNSTSDFLDQNWSQAFSKVTFVNTEEIDFAHFFILAVGNNIVRNASNKSKKFVFLPTSYSD